MGAKGAGAMSGPKKSVKKSERHETTGMNEIPRKGGGRRGRSVRDNEALACWKR